MWIKSLSVTIEMKPTHSCRLVYRVWRKFLLSQFLINQFPCKFCSVSTVPLNTAFTLLGISNTCTKADHGVSCLSLFQEFWTFLHQNRHCRGIFTFADLCLIKTRREFLYGLKSPELSGHVHSSFLIKVGRFSVHHSWPSLGCKFENEAIAMLYHFVFGNSSIWKGFVSAMSSSLSWVFDSHSSPLCLSDLLV